MAQSHALDQPRLIHDDIPGYDYGSSAISKSPVTIQEFELMKQSARFTDEDEQWLHVAGEVLADRSKEVVGKWRDTITAHPHLAKYSLRLDGQKDPRYSERSGLRFQQWVLDTCLRPYDQDWLNYQHEMALRHTSLKKNKTDNAQSVPSIPLRYIIAFGAVVTDAQIIKPFLAARGHTPNEVEKMHQAWSKSIWLQMALWTEPYTDPQLAPKEW